MRYLPGVSEAHHLILGRIATSVSRFDTDMSRTRNRTLPSGRAFRCVFIQQPFQPQKLRNVEKNSKVIMNYKKDRL